MLDVKNINACAIMRFSLYKNILNCKKCDSFIFGSGWRWETRYVTLQMIIFLKGHLRLPLWVWVETGKSLLMAHTCCARFAINRVWGFIYHIPNHATCVHTSGCSLPPHELWLKLFCWGLNIIFPTIIPQIVPKLSVCKNLETTSDICIASLDLRVC